MGHIGGVWRQAALPRGRVPIAESIDFYVDPAARGLTGVILAKELFGAVGVTIGFARPKVLSIWEKLGHFSAIFPWKRWIPLFSPYRMLFHGKEHRFRRYAGLGRLLTAVPRLGLKVLGAAQLDEIEKSVPESASTAEIPFSEFISSEWLRWRLRDPLSREDGSLCLLAAKRGDGIAWWGLIVAYWILGLFGKCAVRKEDKDAGFTPRDLRTISIAGLAVDGFELPTTMIRTAGFYPTTSSMSRHVSATREHEELFEEIKQIKWRLNGL